VPDAAVIRVVGYSCGAGRGAAGC